MESQQGKQTHFRNGASFWIFGLCNNFGYAMMLSAAQDILSKNSEPSSPVDSITNSTEFHGDHCLNDTSTRYCTEVSTGVVLVCNILPCILIKIASPFFIHRIPYGVRHYIACILTVASFLITAFSGNVIVALIGVMVTSFSSGLGENTFLALASHFPPYSISAWCSGTGAAGITASFVYAALTDPLLLNLTSNNTILIAMVVPVIYAMTYYTLLVVPPTVRTVSITEPKSWIDFDTVPTRKSSEEPTEEKKKTADKDVEDSSSTQHHTLREKLVISKGLLIYMVPLVLVYYAEYFINQGLVELSIFDCNHGFGTSPKSQYRWYQVLYQVGVFTSRSSSDVIKLSMSAILLLPVLQFGNVFVFLGNTLHPYIPNFAIACALVLFEGLIGGASYVNSFRHIHENVDSSIREFALGTCSLADSLGILLAAFSAIPVHNAICKLGYL